MYPHELIGKMAIRTRPAILSQVIVDRSFMQEPVRILAATENHIIIGVPNVLNKNEVMQRILPFEHIDNNWTSYDDLMKLASDEHIRMMQQLNGGE